MSMCGFYRTSMRLSRECVDDSAHMAGLNGSLSDGRPIRPPSGRLSRKTRSELAVKTGGYSGLRLDFEVIPIDSPSPVTSSPPLPWLWRGSLSGRRNWSLAGCSANSSLSCTSFFSRYNSALSFATSSAWAGSPARLCNSSGSWTRS